MNSVPEPQMKEWVNVPLVVHVPLGLRLTVNAGLAFRPANKHHHGSA